MIIDSFDPEIFLKEYWQKKPCLIKQFAPDFTDPIDENDLAGLAQEEGVDSRIVSNADEKWHVQQGPFDDFEPYCKGNWALLVQGVNNYIEEVDALCDLVGFIPHWRFDDVMVSYSTKNAGVGAHTDQYDVFIVQGKGSRRWQVGLPNTSAEGDTVVMPHPLLKQIDGFDSVIDEILLPGDAIYIPPMHPHCGMTLAPCLNYSLGFRAPTNMEALVGLIDESDDIEHAQTRYTDADISELRQANLSPMQISNNELNRVKESIVALLHSPQANSALLQYLSRQGLVLETDIPEYSTDEVEDMLKQGAEFEKVAGVKVIYAEQGPGDFVFYIDGVKFTVNSSIAEQTILLLNAPTSRGLEDAFGFGSSSATEWVNLITQLLNARFWVDV